MKMKSVKQLVKIADRRSEKATEDDADIPYEELQEQGINWVSIVGSTQDVKDFFNFLKYHVNKTDMFVEEGMEMVNFRVVKKGK